MLSVFELLFVLACCIQGCKPHNVLQPASAAYLLCAALALQLRTKGALSPQGDILQAHFVCTCMHDKILWGFSARPAVPVGFCACAGHVLLAVPVLCHAPPDLRWDG
jgi:hypothetical protein